MSPKRRKHLEPWEQYVEDRRRRNSEAPKLSEQYPGVSELRFELSLRPHDPPRTPTEQKWVMKRDQRAFFELECLDRECICGGFDLTKSVARMLQAGDQQCEGQLICQGWQDTERYQQHRCMIELTYRVSAIYLAETENKRGDRSRVRT